MVAEYVAGLKVAWDIAKNLKEAANALDDAQIKLQIADLISALADAKIEAAENSEKIVELKKQLKTKSSFSFNGSLYYKENEDNDENEGPYCPTCYDNNDKEIRLHNIAGNPFGNWQCKVCKGYFE